MITISSESVIIFPRNPDHDHPGIVITIARNRRSPSPGIRNWLASGREQPFVINLVRGAASNDEQLFRQHLADNGVQFHVRRWEDLYGLSVVQGEKASVLRCYLK
ncbi:MAG: hypothetical protein WA412_09765, partial [Candidatus Sulfotelmatobacter sp.]